MELPSQFSTNINVEFLQATFNAIPEAIVLADTQRQIISVNKSFIETFGYTKEEVQGEQTSILYASKTDFEHVGKKTFNPESEIESTIYEIEYQRKNGRVFRGETVGSVVKNKEGNTIGYLGSIRDLSVDKKRKQQLTLLTKRLALLTEITTGKEHNPDKQIQQALKLTTDMLDFEIGLVSNIHGNTYTIDYHYPDGIDLEKGMQFELGNTYCSITVEADDVIAIDHMKHSQYEGHPCYKNFELESYIGVPLIVEGETYGTINFSSTKPKDPPFQEADKDMIRLLGEWIGSVLEREKIQQKLYKSREKYRLISTKTADLVCLHAPDGTYEYVSPSVKKILGYSPKELLGTSTYQLFHPEDLERIKKKSHKKTPTNKQMRSTQYRIQKKNGEYIWFETATEPILDNNGEVIKLRTGSRDITERKKIELLLKDTNRLATVGGWEYEIASGDLFWTDEVYRIYELRIGTKVEVEKAIDFYAPEDQPRIQGKLANAIEKAQGYDIELTLITAKGNRKWVRAIGKVQTDENGEVYKLYGVFQDLTERKKMEDQIRERNDQLEKLIKATNEINSIIGHDLKSPLNTINGFSDLLLYDIEKDNGDPQKMRKYLKLISQASRNMSKLLDDLFRWSRLQTGDISINIENILITAPIQSVVDLLGPTAKQKEISFAQQCDEQIEIKADKQIITTIVRNFLSNAIKFSRAGDTIQITCGHENNCWYISVKDEGEGMSKDIQAKLFDPENHPTKRGTENEKGSGIGLRLCNQLAKLHGGTINIESQPGKGSEFTLAVPINLD